MDVSLTFKQNRLPALLKEVGCDWRSRGFISEGVTDCCIRGYSRIQHFALFRSQFLCNIVVAIVSATDNIKTTEMNRTVLISFGNLVQGKAKLIQHFLAFQVIAFT